MSCKPELYIATTTSTAVATNGIVPFNTTVRRRGLQIQRGGAGAVIEDCGSNYYDVDVSVTFTAPVAGVVTLKLQQNGADVIGATGSSTITTATTEVRTITFPATIRTFVSGAIDTLTVVNTGVAITISNATMRIKK